MIFQGHLIQNVYVLHLSSFFLLQKACNSVRSGLGHFLKDSFSLELQSHVSHMKMMLVSLRAKAPSE